MFQIKASNANEALARGLALIRDVGVEQNSRNGDVRVVPAPVCIEYAVPENRVLLSPTRDANPFFHLMESLWMLGGRNDLAFLQQFVKTFDAYSDDGETLHGAYGHRWKHHFGIDQITGAIRELSRNPDSRRVVIGMWNPSEDLPMLFCGGKDVPCNTQLYLSIRGGYLNMTVMNRSNDAVFGCFGANLVHFSVLLEYIAAALRVKVGYYYHFTNNLHLYVDVFSDEKVKKMMEESSAIRPAKVPGVPLVDEENESILDFDSDLGFFLRGDLDAAGRTRFFREVAVPMYRAWLIRKAGGWSDEVLSMVAQITDPHWHQACFEWVDRRRKA